MSKIDDGRHGKVNSVVGQLLPIIGGVMVVVAIVLFLANSDKIFA